MNHRTDLEGAAPPSLEERIDREGREAITLAARLEDPLIREQLLAMLVANEAAWEEKTLYRKIYRDDGTPLVRADGTPVFHPFVYRARSREELLEELQRKIEQISTQTHISFSDREPGVGSEGEIMTLNWKNPFTGERLSNRVMSMAEAHEKGHFIRPFSSNELDKRFASVFDPSAADDALHEFHDKLPGPKHDLSGKPLSYEAWREERHRYLFSATEAAERMSQLKNYFSMTDGAEFTKEMLDYARAHYVEDVGFDNMMSVFFAAITPGKEREFLALMNSAGI